MSLHRRNPKRDSNELAIMDVLEQRGFHVDRVSAPGFPDLVVTKRTDWKTVLGEPGAMEAMGMAPVTVWFVEIKRPKGRFTAQQIAWRQRWQGPPPITLRTVEEALTFPEIPA